MSVRVDYIRQLEGVCGKIREAVNALELIDRCVLLDWSSDKALDVAQGRLNSALGWIETSLSWEKQERGLRDE